jgi:hypothetical protein
MPAKPATIQVCNTQSCQECTYSYYDTGQPQQRVDNGCHSSYWIWEGAPGMPRDVEGTPSSISVGGYVYWLSGCRNSSWCDNGLEWPNNVSWDICAQYNLCRRPA